MREPTWEEPEDWDEEDDFDEEEEFFDEDTAYEIKRDALLDEKLEG